MAATITGLALSLYTRKGFLSYFSVAGTDLTIGMPVTIVNTHGATTLTWDGAVYRITPDGKIGDVVVSLTKKVGHAKPLDDTSGSVTVTVGGSPMPPPPPPAGIYGE